jgi:hypothetical protein
MTGFGSTAAVCCWDVSAVFMLEAKRQLLLGADVPHAARAAR